MEKNESQKTADELLSGEQSEKEPNHQYHPPACASLELELRDVRDEVAYHPEFLLNTGPNRIDVLVVSRLERVHSSSGLAAIFKKYNIIEYKSPNDALDTAIFYRTTAYAYLLAAKYQGIRPERDVTLTFIRKRKPVNLIRELREWGYELSEYEPGIYHVKRKDYMDMQIIVTRQLGERYHWITVLTDQVEIEDIERIREDIAGFTDERDLLNAEAVFNLIVQLNQNKKWVKELTGMGAFRDLFQEEFDKKDREIAEQREEILDLSEQLQTQSEQLQTQSEQLQSEQEKNNRLQKEVEDLKRQLQELAGKIAVL